jgi:hypothetical protein
MQIDQNEMRKAIERHRISKKRNESAFEFAGADLNGDGRAEALVLFTGQDWCSPMGCSLVVFQPEEFGFRPISHIVGVKAPVGVAPEGNAGWRDLVVKSGGGPGRIVRLQFTGGGYPVNAAIQPEVPRDQASLSEVVITGGQLTAAAPVANSGSVGGAAQ